MHIPPQSSLPDAGLATQTIRLARGQAMQVWLPAGSRIVCHAPAARITEAPQWLANQLVCRRSELADGQAMALEHGGWIEILAPRGGTVLCLAPQAQPWRQPLALLRRLLQWMRPVAPARR
jgi:hypothetical protein